MGTETHSVGRAQPFYSGEPLLLPQLPLQGGIREGRGGNMFPAVLGIQEKSAPPKTGAGEMYSQQSHLNYMFPYKYF